LKPVVAVRQVVWVLAVVMGGWSVGASPSAAQVADDAGTAPGQPAAPALEVVVQKRTATTELEQSARSVSVLTLDRQRRTPSDPGTLLARNEGISVRRTGGLGSSARFAMAGLSDEQIPIFVDGVPLEIAGYPFGLVNIPTGLLTRVEVYRGVVPLRFGADALGGAVDLVTEAERPGPAHAVFSYQAGSFDTHRLTGTLRYRHKPSGFVLRGSGFFDYARNDYAIRVPVYDDDGSSRLLTERKRNDAYRGGAGTLETGFLQRSWARRLLLRYTHAELDKRIPHDPTMDTAFGEVSSHRAADGLSLRYESPTFHDASIAALAAYSGRRVDFDDTALCAYDWVGRCTRMQLPGGESGTRPYDQHIRQHTGFARLSASYAPSHWAKLLLSSTLSATRRTGQDDALEPADDALRGRRDLLTVVSGLEHELDAWDERVQNIASVKNYVELVRAEQWSEAIGFWDADQNHSRFGVADGLRVRLIEPLQLKLAYEWATRLPAPDQIFGDGVLIQTNLALAPESSHNVNVGLIFDLPNTHSGDYRAGVNGFGRFSQDMIFLLVGYGQSQFDNVASSRGVGVEGRVGWTSPRRYLQLDANCTWQDLRNTSSAGEYARYKGDRMPNRPYLFANLSAVASSGDWLAPDLELSLAWYGNYIHEFETGWDMGSVATRPKVPSRVLYTLEGTLMWRRDGRAASASLQLNNLSNARSYDVFGVQLPGRSVLAKLTLEV
jgi:vitamin B12 transporter